MNTYEAVFRGRKNGSDDNRERWRVIVPAKNRREVGNIIREHFEVENGTYLDSVQIDRVAHIQEPFTIDQKSFVEDG